MDDTFEEEKRGEKESEGTGSFEEMRERLRMVNENRLRLEREAVAARSEQPASPDRMTKVHRGESNVKMPSSLVYLDWAATAPLSRAVAQALAPFFAPGITGMERGSGNANALHRIGRDTFKILETARRDVARCIDARPDEIIFTSGATEADNSALLGIAEGALRRTSRGFQPMQKISSRKPSVVVSAIEHDAVLAAAHALEQQGFDVVYIKPDRSGHITPVALKDTLARVHQPLLVSIMALNNETGAVMEIPTLSDIAHRAGALFHTDATQAIGKIAVSVREWRVDALSLSAHKIGGPKGVGALYLKARTPFRAQILGGGQESNRRSGTQNVAGAVGLAVALREAIDHQRSDAQHMRQLRDRLYEGLLALPGVEAVVDPTQGGYGPHIVTIMCPGFESETLILQLDKRGICASGGSACSSRSLDPSHVLTAMGFDRDRALGMLRFSLGPDTTIDEIDYCIAKVGDVLRTSRK